MIVISLVVVAILALMLYLREVYSIFSNKGVNHLPVVPFFGNAFKAFFYLENFTETMTKLSSTFPDDKVVGMYEFRNAFFVVQDLETIKNVTIKDFEYFVDRRSFTGDLDPNYGRVLFSLKGKEWKQMRSTLSPAFTSSKIRIMVPLIVDVGDEMMKVLSKRIRDSESRYIDVNLKDLTTRYANDVIASCAFGLKVESQSGDNHFYKKAKEMTSFNVIAMLKVLLYRVYPYIASKLDVRIVSKETLNFFTDVVLGTMIEREKKNIVRPDMINILNEIKKGKLSHEKETENDSSAGFATVEESDIGKKVHNREWSDTDLVAQAIQFLFGGFDTVSTTMSFILHELAVHPDIQERLVQEIMEHDIEIKKNNGNFDFNSIQNMKYLDMVVSESLRLHPPVPLLDRKCVKEYNFGRVNKTSTQDLIVRKGDKIACSIRNFHHDPQLFPEPDKFDPERFSEENSHKIKPFSYMPFGLGPRNCIASRFALCELKVMLYTFLRKMKVTPCDKTTIPVELMKGFLMYIKDGGWVRLQLR